MHRPLTAAIALLFVLPFARPAFAHGFGQSYNLPVPLWLYLYGAAAAVVLSSVPLSMFAGEVRYTASGFRYPRLDLFRVRIFRALVNARPLVVSLRLLSVALFALVVFAGLFGEQSGHNVAPIFVWAIWWVGLGFFVAFVGNIWPVVNPWKILFEWAHGLARRLGRKDGIELRENYPASLGVWPAVVVYVTFVWIENVFSGSAVPRYLALFILSYTLVVFNGMALFGKETWLRRGEAFSVFFDLLGRFAPTEVRTKEATVCRSCDVCGEADVASGIAPAGECVDCHECFTRAAPEERGLNLRPLGVGLGQPGSAAEPGGVVFVVLVLAGVTYDGLLETPFWVEVVRLTPFNQTFGLVLVVALFLCAYLVFVGLSLILGGGRNLRRFAAAYAFSLVPIAVAYQVAHYYTLLLVQGQVIVGHASDPFGWGWNLFGTAGFQPRYGLVGAGFVWYSQVALIVAGHVVAVYLAHGISLRLLGDQKRALLSQLPMLVLMVLYTVSSLWILAQPIVA